jgi:hypothetical protein
MLTGKLPFRPSFHITANLWCVITTVVLLISVVNQVHGKGGVPVADRVRSATGASIFLKVTVKEFVVSADSDEPILPVGFALSQNRPNPFNPSTIIEYNLPRACKVMLTIRNILGQRVRVLVDEYQSPGYMTATWNSTHDDGSKVASGVYFYTLSAGDYVNTKKMIVLK